MGAIDRFFRRFGYAKLDRYGLILTADDRVLSTRPAVLDDGLGSKIVGWTEDDLAAMELDRWGAAAKAAPAKPVAAPKSLHRPAPPPVPRLPGVAQVIAPLAPMPVMPVAAPVGPPVAVAPVVAAAIAPVAAAPVVAKAPVVAEEPVVEEDEWEWDIAMARARAAAEWAAEEAAKIAPAKPVAAKPVAPKAVVPVAVKPPAQDRKTVIPVPELRTTPGSSLAPRRMPRGTGPVNDDTVQTLAAPPANDDTTPYVTLPNEVRPVGYAHTKRVAAKQR